ncbi:Outward-rectifier potassium channel TOK1 [Colletotrichum tanaceti]|uniref:Outward-rectifier potassium channel TOK1 n=1 Tax=Colletotrichum tanaceti TaxID=1306861 RepID=A0A4U6XM78_9PEZI|nr:Outward-rectifier potassium channel TOK1 [Colletotrichum tanaceti]TKW56775.1 Outward-rectifier potassium channel TOK1 [Colletotrichum tanaceti]
MNDADLGDNIEERIGQLEQSKQRRDKRFANDVAHLDPSRWWFASSAFPMIAGTLGPVASAFSICALVRPWRQRFPPGTDIAAAPFVEDPKWLIIINAIQLAIAIISNVFLLLNMARRVRFSLAQPVTIVGWYLSAVCLVTLNATAAGPLALEPADEHILSQAFFYGMFAAILYFVTASLMVVTVYGAHARHYAEDFQLTTAQRTLMLQTILFLLYLLLGALVFSTVEGWTYLDAVYWADVTLFTVGFGDYAAASPLGRALLIPYALIGVISLGLVIGSIRTLVLERGRRRLDARMVEKKRRHLILSMIRKGKDDILKPIHEGSEAASSASPSPSSSPATELERREREFDLMRTIQDQASIRRRWMAMSVSFSSWLVLWLVGAKVFQECERPYQSWSYFDGFYFAFVTLTTIGYGDRTPVSNAGKAFFVFWSLLALPTMTVMISNAGDTVIKAVRDATLELGNITILPGERGFHEDLMSFLHRLTCGFLFHPSDSDSDSDSKREEEGERGGEKQQDNAEDGAELPPSFLSNAHRLRQSHPEEDGDTDEDRKHSSGPLLQTVQQQPSSSSSLPDPAASREKQPGQQQQQQRQRRRRTRTSSRTRTRCPATALPSSRANFHFLLISEIAAVRQHAKEKPARRYTYAEWAWYLKLIGEDESSSTTHRKARPHIHSRTKETEKETENGERSNESTRQGEYPDEDKWSWVGPQSPLMGSQEECEWILEKLTDKLRDELDAVRGEEARGGGEHDDGQGNRSE